MAEPLPFDRCLSVLEDAAGDLVARARTAGLGAPVPTCPGWAVADLVAHQGMVHRWASSNLRRDGATVPSKTQILEDVPAAQLLAWCADGVRELLTTLENVDPDAPAMVFLRDAPAPRHFWARRQAHETTIHSVDALAGALGRVPSAAEARIDDDVAVDGIDELLTGFVPRGRSKLAEEAPLTIAVVPSDSDRRWTMRVADERLTTERRQAEAECTLSGTARQLYLGLWNRGDEVTASGRPDVLERWRAVQRIRWS